MVSALADELHKPIKRKFKTRRVIVNYIDEIWAAEYLLMVIDVFSKYGWIVPLKNKQGETIREASTINTVGNK